VSAAEPAGGVEDDEDDDAEDQNGEQREGAQVPQPLI
jgi:hypothetical protein